MDNAKRKYKGGRKPKLDKANNRYVMYLNDTDNARFLSLFEKSGMRAKAHFIASRVFGEEFKVIHVDKNTLDYYSKLSSFYSQFRAIGVNYNQVVKALNTHFTEKKALATLYKLEKITIELVGLNRQIIELTQKYEQQWLQK